MPAPSLRRRRLTTGGVVAVVVAALLPALLFSGDAGAAVRPTELAFTTQPGDGAPGKALTAQPRVVTTDDTGKKIASTATIAITLTGPNGAALTSVAALTALTCRSTTSVTATSGTVAFTGCQVDHGGIYTLTATDAADDITVVSSSFFVSGPAQLRITAQPGGGAAGAAWASQPEVTVADGHGDTVTGATATVGLAVLPGTGTAGAALTCTGTDSVVDGIAPTSGVVHFAGCALDKAGSGYQLVAVDKTDELISAASSAFAVSAGAPSGLGFAQAPLGGTGGTAFSTQPVVRVQDAFGNPAVGNTDTVSLSIAAGTGAAGAQITCPDVAAVDGVATFAGCSIDRAGTGYVLVATDSASGLTQRSAAFAVTSGGASRIAFTTQPGGGAGGVAFATQPVVTVTDDGGNVVTDSSVTLTIVPGTGTAGATVACTANPATGATGAVGFAGCSVSTTGTGYELRATAGALTVDSAPFDVTAGSPARATFATQPGNGTGGSAFAAQPTVTLADSGGNSAAGPVTLAIAAGTGTPGATLSCATNPVASSNGTAGFTGCSIDEAGTGYRLVATSGSARTQSAAFDVTVGAPAQLTFTAQPGGGTGGAAWADQPVVTVRDAGGNQVAADSASIALTVASGTGSGTLACTATELPAVRGAAQFDGCRIDRTASAYRLTATDATDGLSTTSAPFAVVAGPAAALVFSGQPGGGNAGVALPAQPTVTRVDLGGNPASDAAPVTLAVTPGSGTGGTLACSSTTVTASPVATFAGCSVGSAGGGYTLTATSGPLHAESTPFAVLLAPPTPLGVAPTDVPTAQTFGGHEYAVNPTDVVDDVNTATGSLTLSRQDLTVAGIGLPFDLTRTYNSADTTGGVFGPGWSSVLDLGVTVAADGSTATVRGEDGQQLVFRSKGLAGVLGWTAPPGARSSLTCLLLSCTVTRFDGTSFTVAGGHVVAYRTAQGQGLTFDWSQRGKVTVTVRTTASMPLLVVGTLDTTGRLLTLASPTRSVGYGYTDGLLTTVEDVRGQTWTYGYSTRLLSGETDPLGHVRLTATYGADGRVTATTQPGDAKLVDDTFAWSAGTATRSSSVNVQGQLQRVTSTDQYVGNVLVQQTDAVGAVVRMSYDTRVNLVEVQDAAGWVTQLAYDSADNLIRRSTPISSTSAAVTSYTYDGLHRLATQTDANGNTTQYVYIGTQLWYTYPPGVDHPTQDVYDAYSRLTEVRTPSGKTVYGYDAAGNRTSVQQETLQGAELDAAGTVSTFDEAGNRLTSLDPRGQLTAKPAPAFLTTWTYDAAGHRLSQTLPGQARTTSTYDAAGDLVAATSAAGTTTYAWNGAAGTLTLTAPGGTSVQAYDPSGHLLTQTDPATHLATTHVYDAAGRELTTTEPDGTTSTFSYDAVGNVVRASDSSGNTVTRQFDSLNRIVRQVLNGVVTTTTWDAMGNTVGTTDGSGAVTTATYNAHGKVTAVTTAAGTTRYSYDDTTDELLSTTDAAGHVTTYTYDAARRRTASTLAGATTRYGYDLAGNVDKVTDPVGRVTSTTYNAADLATTTVNRQTGRPTLTVKTAYDAAGRRIRMTDATGVHTYTYDAQGNLTSAAGPDGTFRYDYSKPGTITETYPDGTVIRLAVDDAQNLMSVTTGQVGTAGYVTASYVRNADRQTTAVAYGNGVLETVAYDASGDVVDQQLRNAAGALSDDTYTYDASGNRLTQRTTTGGITMANRYGYDSLGRLTSFTTASGAGTLTGATVPTVSAPATAPDTSATISGGPSVTPAFGVTTAVDPSLGGAATSYAYDAVGNRVTTSTAAGRTTTKYDGADRISTQRGPGATTWTYDKAGDVTKIGATTFAYDAAGRLASATTGSSTVTYAYDGDGNRISKTVGSTVTKYVWDSVGPLPQLAIERTGSGSLLRRYIYGDGPVAMQTPTATYYFHLDPSGSVTALTDASGAMVAHYAYDAFGNVTTTGSAPPSNPLLFQGQYLDSDTGLYDMRARNYDPRTGRFTQRDPQEHPVGSASESPYVFAANRPTVMSDPSGRVTAEGAAQSTFWGHANTETNVASDVKLGLAATGAGLKGGLAIAKLIEPVAEATVASIKTAGSALAGVGLALQVFIMVEDCLTKDAYACAGAVVGTAVSIGFLAGCSFVTGGVAAPACAIGGALLSIGLQYVITNFGPDITAGIVAGATALAGLTVQGAGIVAQGAVELADAVSTFGVNAAGAIVSGFDDATTAVSSGFATAMSTLTDAGYAAVQLADVLAHDFVQTFDQALAGLVGLGYAIGDIASSVAGVFAATATQVAQAFKDGFDYSAQVIAGALQSAYGTLADGAAQILSGVGFAVDEVAGVLQSTYHLAAAAAAAALDGVGYAAGQIAGALDTVFGQADQAAAQILAGLDATAGQVATALRDFYADADAATAAALQFADYTATLIAGALGSAYADAAHQVGQILHDLSYGASVVAGALVDVFTTLDVATAQILKSVGYAVLDVAVALQGVFDDAAQAAASALRSVGYAVAQVATALQQTFQQTADAAADVLRTLGYDVLAVGQVLGDVFGQAADAAAATLQSVGYAFLDVATALRDTFGEAAADAARILDGLYSDTTALALALRDLFGQSAQQVAAVFQGLGRDAAQLGAMLADVFGQGASAVAGVLKGLAIGAADIAAVLGSTFGQGTDAIVNVLQSVGFTSDEIKAIGGAIGDFFSSIGDAFCGAIPIC